MQGVQYSFHDQAAALLGVPEEQRQSVDTHPNLYKLFKDRTDALAVVAFVNTTKGPVEGSYERIAAGIGTVIGKVDLDIVLPLYGIPGATLDDIGYVHTQKHALDQVRKILEDWWGDDYEKYWVSEDDTALSAISVREQLDISHAAITPHPAGRAAGLKLLHPNMRDNLDRNVTSFYLLGKGRYSKVPEDATVMVGALRRVGDDYPSIERLERTVGHGTIRLVHESDVKSDLLIVEMDGGNLCKAQDALDGLYTVAELGGYGPLTVA